MATSESSVRRALRRVGEAGTPSPAEAETLMHARGRELDRLILIAGSVRDAGLAGAGRPGTVTYSRNVFVPVTRLCRNRCHYCTFTSSPAALARSGAEPFLPEAEVLDLVGRAARAGCKEVLMTLGDRPEDRWPPARTWLERAGYTSTLGYVRELAVRILRTTGLLPHINPGAMSWEEIGRLRPVAPSLGTMLETTADRLWSTPGGAHHGSVDKEPAVRLRVLRDAGRLAVPFTTGILVGIGETRAERVDSLLAVRAMAQQFGNVQEVIVQNFRAKPGTPMRSSGDLDPTEYLATVAVARLVLGPSVRIQVPPNLSEPEQLPRLLAAGVDDWGGISPVTDDHVNPERPWPGLEELARTSRAAGFELVERLAVHPEYVRAADHWLDPRVVDHVRALADPVTGLADPTATPKGLPWREPDPLRDAGGPGVPGPVTAPAGTGRDGRAPAACPGRQETRTRSARGFDELYGNWDLLREQARRALGTGTAPAPPLLDATAPGSRDATVPDSRDVVLPDRRDATAPERIDPETAEALRRAESGGADLPREQALALATATGPALEALVDLADGLRQQAVGDDVTYVVNRNINFTNVCYTGCRFCAYARRRQDPDALRLTLDEVGDRAGEAWLAGATEICMQGGIDPHLPASGYFDLARTVKAAAPRIHLHAFSPMEVINGAARTGLSVTEWFQEARTAGVDSVPGTAAEILDDDVRWLLTKGKIPTSTWVEVISAAHAAGLPSSSTMMYGHVDSPEHWVMHLRLLADLQRESLEHRAAAFTEFVPLPFVHHNTPIYLAGVCRPGPTMRENVLVHALARVLLHGLIPNVQTSWVKLGTEGTRTMLRGGANDLGGTLMEEAISRTAGARFGSALTETELRSIASGISRRPRERTSLYGVPEHRPGPFPVVR